MEFRFSEIEGLLAAYLSGDISDPDRSIVDRWREESPENEAYFNEMLKAWESIPLLQEMEQFNSFEALKKVNRRLSGTESSKWWINLQTIAAILLLPLLAYSGYLTIDNFFAEKQPEEQVMIQTITSRPGVITNFSLADGTKVWLNSGSQLEFPMVFKGNMREVKLKGEAFFDVSRIEEQPFRVDTRDLKVAVLGTSFNVVCYDDEHQSEVILVEGKVSLQGEKGQIKNQYSKLHAGQRAVYDDISEKVCTQEVSTDKYIAWRDGNLIFRDDPMEDVVRRLSRWYNVEIIFNDPEMKSYIYTATFKNESLEQVLKLLKLSAPIDYKIIGSEPIKGNEFSKQKILLMGKNS